jgi:hypothetical protein
MKRILIAAGAALLAATAIHAQTIEIEQLQCIPTGDNALVKATAANEPGGASPRLYFRWRRDQGEFYWVELEPAGGGNYWGVFPRPERRNTEVEYYATLVNAAGAEVAKSTVRTVKVNGNCPVKLAEREEGVAGNLTVGETVAQQQGKGKGVLGFLCDGIVTRVNYEGIRRSDEVCRACVIAWWQLPAMAAVPTVGILIIDDPVSPSRP